VLGVRFLRKAIEWGKRPGIRCAREVSAAKGFAEKIGDSSRAPSAAQDKSHLASLGYEQIGMTKRERLSGVFKRRP
jgi:hypothetical protein